MKDFINFYYNLNIKKILVNNENFILFSDNSKYLLKKIYDYTFNEYYMELEQEIDKYKYFFKIIKNKDNNYITTINNRQYVLLKISNIENSKISIFDIKTNMYIKLNQKLNIINRSGWIKMWENKIDYYEELFYQNKQKFQKILPIFNFYIGIAENALLYIKEIEKKYSKTELDNLVISHDRISYNYELYDYYNPLNIIIDHPSRDISEYIKSKIEKGEFNIELLKDYLEKNVFSDYGIRIMYSRIIFPSFFFDFIEKSVINSEKLNFWDIEKITKNYLKNIKEISDLLEKKYQLLTIPWIKKHR